MATAADQPAVADPDHTIPPLPVPVPVSLSSVDYEITSVDFGDFSLSLRQLRISSLLSLCSTAHPAFAQHCFTGLQTWSGTEILCRLLLARPQLALNRRVLELGGGTGLGALIAAKINANAPAHPDFLMFSTDGEPESVKLIESNFSLNFTPQFLCYTRFCPLLFGVDSCQQFQRDYPEAANGFQLIIGSELIYQRVAIDELMQTIAALLAPCDRSVAVLVHTARQENSQDKLRQFGNQLNCSVRFADLTDFLPSDLVINRFWVNVECVFIYRQSSAQVVEPWIEGELGIRLQLNSQLERRMQAEERSDGELFSQLEWNE